MANKIVILEDSVINKIAAGEVVERPASVVKELVENSLDARANRITIEVQEGGKKLIRVSDDGCGMSREDAILALQRHATSKIRTASDLFDIRTLGFRGEALPSIAAVSHLELVTHQSTDLSGIQVTAEAGVITDVKEIGAPPGTTVTVSNLFYNTPARLKFLKGASIEMNHINDWALRFALANYQVSFRLIHNNQESFSSPGFAKPFDALLNLYGKEVATQTVPIGLYSPSIKVEGFISKPNLTRASRAHQLFFVNRRFVRSRLLLHAVDEACKTLFTVGRYPIVVLYLEVEPHLVDVNVHPTKIEVHFNQEWEVHNFVSKAIRKALGNVSLIPELKSQSISLQAPKVKIKMRQPSLIKPPMQASKFTELLAKKTPLPETISSPQVSDLFATEVLRPIALGTIKPLGQIHNSYILAEGEEELLIIDQHAAHERIWYEKLTKALEDKPIEIQRLISPYTLELTHTEKAVVEENLEALAKLGFHLESFGKSALLVRSIPAFLAKRDYKRVLRDIIDELVALSGTKEIVMERENMVLTAVCRQIAVRAGTPLIEEEMEKLINQLAEVKMPFTCPHGRPTIISLPIREIERKFKRT